MIVSIVLVLIGMVTAPIGQAQAPEEDSLSLAERYRTARFQKLAQEYLTGRRTVPIQPPRLLPVRWDSMLGGLPNRDTAASEETERRSFPLDEVRHVRDLERSWFRERYREVEWSFLGTGTRFTVFDTTRTRDLRARLQAQFGDPTRTMVELYSKDWRRAPDSSREEPIQFEYWFIVNDSIPVRVLDVDGPSERGVIVSTDRRHREQLPALRAALLHPIRSPKRAPYVDYYYEDETGRWYRVGYDGVDFFRERISRYDIIPGRRPVLDTVREESSPDAEETSSASTSSR